MHGKEESECIAEMDHVLYFYMGEESICLVIDDFDPSWETLMPGKKPLNEKTFYKIISILVQPRIFSQLSKESMKIEC